MRKSTLIILLFSAAIFFSLHANAQEEKYDAPYLSITKEYTLNADGSMDYRYIKQQKLLTYRAFHNLYGESFVVYNPDFQKLKINEVFTTMANGKKVVAPENAFNEVLPGNAANAPFYNSLREMVITHTGLERNAVINLDYQVHTNKGVNPALMGNELLAEIEPVKNLEIRVRIPEGKTLFFHLFNLEIKPVITTDGSFRVYTWKFSEIAPVAGEESQPGINERYPRLIFSSSDNRVEVYSFLTGQPAFLYAIPEEAKKMVNAILEEKKDKFDIALEIQDRVVNDMRYYSIPFRPAAYVCRTPEQTWNSNGGTAVEKAVLMTALLKTAGIDARVAAVVRTAFLDDKVATLADIDDFVVKIENKERGTWYLSVTGLNPVNLKYTLPGRSFIQLEGGVKPVAEKAEDPKQTVKVLGNFIVSSDPKLTGEMSIYYNGSAYPFAGLQRDRKKMKNSVTGGLIGKDSTNLKTSTLNTENGFQSYIVQSDKPFRKDTNFFYFNLPVSTLGVESWGIKTLAGKRETPFEIASQADESYSFTFTLPTSFTLFTPERKIQISNKSGVFVWEVKSEGGKVSVKRQLKFNSRVFEGAVYDDFKALMDAWNNMWYRQLIFVAGQ